MTSEQLAAVKIGDRVSLADFTGQVTRAAPSWFLVTWQDESVLIVKRDSWGSTANRMELHA